MTFFKSQQKNFRKIVIDKLFPPRYELSPETHPDHYYDLIYGPTVSFIRDSTSFTNCFIKLRKSVIPIGSLVNRMRTNIYVNNGLMKIVEESKYIL